MTSVELWFRDSFDTEIVEGGLTSLTNALNIAASNGHAFTILPTETGPLMVETHNIIRARERDDDGAFIGG